MGALLAPLPQSALWDPFTALTDALCSQTAPLLHIWLEIIEIVEMQYYRCEFLPTKYPGLNPLMTTPSLHNLNVTSSRPP